MSESLSVWTTPPPSSGPSNRQSNRNLMARYTDATRKED